MSTIERSEPRSLGGLLLPLILVGLGVAFLLANLGYLPPISLRALFDVWPIALILIGIEMLLGRRQPALSLGLQLVALGLAVAIVASQSAGLLAAAAGGTSFEAVDRAGASSLTLDVNSHMGDIRLAGGSSALVVMSARGGTVDVNTDREGDRAEVDIHPDHEFVLPFQGLRTDMDLGLASDVPTSLDLEIGPGKVDLDFRAVQLTTANINAGAGDISIVLPTPQGEVPIEIDAGAAQVTIEVPSGIEARVTVEGGAVSLDSVNPRLAASGGSAQTAGYAGATSRVTVTIDAGAATVHIR